MRGFRIGDIVESVGGNFTEGIIEDIWIENLMELVKVKWVEHTDNTGTKKPINFIQQRSSSIIRLKDLTQGRGISDEGGN